MDKTFGWRTSKWALIWWFKFTQKGQYWKKKKKPENMFTQNLYWVLYNQVKACKSRRIRQRMDKVHGSNLNFLIINEHCIYTRMNTAQWHVTDNKTFSLIHTHLCWLSDIQTQLSVTRNCIKRVVFSSKPTALKQRYLSLSRVELHPMTILSPYVLWTEYYHVP